MSQDKYGRSPTGPVWKVVAIYDGTCRVQKLRVHTWVKHAAFCDRALTAEEIAEDYQQHADDVYPSWVINVGPHTEVSLTRDWLEVYDIGVWVHQPGRVNLLVKGT